MTATALSACSFTENEWVYDDALDGPVLVCDVHVAPAEGYVYGTGAGLCQPQAEYVRAHAHPRADDPARCLCGRPWDTCLGAVDARALVQAVPAATCRHCSREIRRNTLDQWVDETRDPAYCPHAISFQHAPRQDRP